jgi:hypothetical protein
LLALIATIGVSLYVNFLNSVSTICLFADMLLAVSLDLIREAVLARDLLETWEDLPSVGVIGLLLVELIGISGA